MNVKYRIWCKSNQEWEKDEIAILSNGNILHLSTARRFPCMVKKDIHIIQVYTGLKDKNKKEIYEGDILNPNLREVIFKTNVKCGSVFNCAGFYTHCHRQNRPEMLGLWTFGQTQAEVSEVIGNIFENPELLEDLPCEQ